MKLARAETPDAALTSSRSGLLWSLAISALAFCSALPFAFLDFDPHHDGLVTTAALAVRDGAVVQRDVFSQYGPVGPWVQGLVLHLSDYPALTLRLLNIIAIAAIAFSLAELGRHVPRFWPVSPSPARWAAVSWVLVADYFLWVPQLPWSSIIAVAFASTALLLIARSLWHRENGIHRRSNWLVAAAGVLIGLVPFTRLTIGVSLTLSLIVLGLLIALKHPATRTWLFLGAASMGAAWAVIVSVLLSTNALAAYWNQAILWPLRWSTDTGDQPSVGLLAAGMVSLWLGLLGILLVALAGKRNLPGAIAQPHWIAGVSIASALWIPLALWLNWDGWSSPFVPFVGEPDAHSSTVIAANSRLLLLLVVASLLLSFVVIGRALIPLLRNAAFASTAAASILFALFALSLLTQIYPITDTRHLWWALPIPLVLVYSSLSRYSSWSPARNPLAPAIVIAGIGSIVAGSNYLAVPRVDAPPANQAAGLRLQPNAASTLAEGLRTLHTELGPEQAIFLTKDGVWAAYDGTYHSIDEYFVDWGTPEAIAPRLTDVFPPTTALHGGGPSDWSLGVVGAGTSRGLSMWPTNYSVQGPSIQVSAPSGPPGDASRCWDATFDFTWEFVRVTLSSNHEPHTKLTHQFDLIGVDEAFLVVNPSGTTMTWSSDGFPQTWILPQPVCIDFSRALVSGSSTEAVDIAVWNTVEAKNRPQVPRVFAGISVSGLAIVDGPGNANWASLLTAFGATPTSTEGLLLVYEAPRID